MLLAKGHSPATPLLRGQLTTTLSSSPRKALSPCGYYGRPPSSPGFIAVKAYPVRVTREPLSLAGGFVATQSLSGKMVRSGLQPEASHFLQGRWIDWLEDISVTDTGLWNKHQTRLCNMRFPNNSRADLEKGTRTALLTIIPRH